MPPPSSGFVGRYVVKTGSSETARDGFPEEYNRNPDKGKHWIQPTKHRFIFTGRVPGIFSLTVPLDAGTTIPGHRRRPFSRTETRRHTTDLHPGVIRYGVGSVTESMLRGRRTGTGVGGYLGQAVRCRRNHSKTKA